MKYPFECRCVDLMNWQWDLLDSFEKTFQPGMRFPNRCSRARSFCTTFDCSPKSLASSLLECSTILRFRFASSLLERSTILRFR